MIFFTFRLSISRVLRNGLFAIACTTTVGCRTPATQIQLFIDTDAPTTRSVRVDVYSFKGAIAPTELPGLSMAQPRGSIRLERNANGEGTFTGGGSIGVLPPTDSNANTVTLWLRATIGSTANSPEIVVDRAARVSFVRGRSGTARIFLPLSCGDTAVGCTSVSAAACTVSVRCREQNATCGDFGQCVEPEVPVTIVDGDGAVFDGTSLAADAGSGRPGADVADVDDAADVVSPPSAPRPIAPMSLGDVSLRQPTFRWELPADFDGVEIQLCRNRACTDVIETIRAQGTSARPTMALAPSTVVFWRLRGTRGLITGSEYSATWLFHVPATDNSGAIDTSRTPHLDVNGDGFDDVVVGAAFASPGGRTTAGTVSVFHGNSQGISMTPQRLIEGAASGAAFGNSVASAGDLDGDGFGELIVGSNTASPGGRMRAGSAVVFRGSFMGLESEPILVLEGVAAGDGFGKSVACAGDINRDGYADLIVGADFADSMGRSNSGTASIFTGNSQGIRSSPELILAGANANEVFGASVAGAGDVNGDGFSDVVVGAFGAAPGGRTAAGAAAVYLGSAMGLSAAPAITFEGTSLGDGFGNSVATAGDVNGDGFSDLGIGAYQADADGMRDAGAVAVFHGSALGLSPVANRLLVGDSVGITFGVSVASAGDMNGDGFSDLIVGAPRTAVGGTTSVYLGAATGLPSIANRQYQANAMGDLFGAAVAGAGDINGDGFQDIIIGAYTASVGPMMLVGTATIFHGSALGPSAIPQRVLQGVELGGVFGSAVADLTMPDGQSSSLNELRFYLQFIGHSRVPFYRRG